MADQRHLSAPSDFIISARYWSIETPKGTAGTVSDAKNSNHFFVVESSEEDHVRNNGDGPDRRPRAGRLRINDVSMGCRPQDFKGMHEIIDEFGRRGRGI
jgi:hypothetical protein